jgi:hypothetical protein
VAVVVREAAVPSSPRWWCWSPVAAVALVVVVAELVVLVARRAPRTDDHEDEAPSCFATSLSFSQVS